MLTGRPPFLHEYRDKLYKLIKYSEPQLNYNFISDDARNLCQNLLNKDPLKRLGSSKDGAIEVMKHPWFAKIDWD